VAPLAAKVGPASEADRSPVMFPPVELETAPNPF
jgi:hypothetical protein